VLSLGSTGHLICPRLSLDFWFLLHPRTWLEPKVLECAGTNGKPDMSVSADSLGICLATKGRKDPGKRNHVSRSVPKTWSVLSSNLHVSVELRMDCLDSRFNSWVQYCFEQCYDGCSFVCCDLWALFVNFSIMLSLSVILNVNLFLSLSELGI